MSIDPDAFVHPTAIVEEGAVIGPGARVGPFSLIGPEVRLGPGVDVKSHAVVTGDTEIGEDTAIFPFTSVGDIPQDLKFSGEKTRLVIGRRNRIREGTTINVGTEGGGGVTRIGDDCLFMANAHVAHDVQIGNRVILVNGVGVAGHCIIEDDVIVGGLSGVHQFVRIGRGAIIGGLTKVSKDVIPFGMVQGAEGALTGLNLVGLKRRGVSRTDISALRAAYRALAEGEGPFAERAQRLGAAADSDYVREIAAFILSRSDRSFLTPG